MRAYELLARIRCLVMTEVDGQIEWIGTQEDWRNVAYEEDRIIESYKLKQTGI